MIRLFVICTALWLLGCTEQDSDTPMPTPAQSVKGVALSPRSFSGEDFTQFFTLAEDAGTFVTWAGNWNELGNQQSAAEVVATLDNTYDYQPVIITSWFNTSDGAPYYVMTDTTKQRFLSYVEDFALRHQPPIMVMGLELNTAYDYSAQNYAEFAAFFPQVVASIHAASPQTKVGPDFLWEKMLGYRGGLFGGVNDTTQTQFELLADFPNADFLGFNSYPSLIFAHPDSLPTNYYTRIHDFTDLPVAFFETGWHSGATIPGWESSETEQARFVEKLFQLTESLEPLALIWPFLFDPDAQQPFNSMGLWDRNTGLEKQAWSVWLEAEM